MATVSSCNPSMPVAPFSFSLLVSSPIRCNLPFSPVSAMIFPFATVELPFASLIVAGINIFINLLVKRSLVQAPTLHPVQPSLSPPITLTLPQLMNLLQHASEGTLTLPNGSPSGQGLGPVGEDEPLFPDNLSFSLSVSAPIASFDGSPDTNFNVPLFEIPGVPGNLILALAMILSQYLIERTGIGTPGCTPTPASQ
ncbi:hypothetical protein [Desulfitobacterium metallireducens]|uniref:Uncharacterized protein n=1 Tax=Desulfitobacterium metallireducens DSM 15288 TaxID=871968 RepID=W0EB59_9FIRM|nr:hypothetical protein [Desulfitobacterium metallireducens]AHF08002.1 hypothetical protein DESME_13915 [Desulfitobacterium metallireducens DSM 15288]